MSGDAKENSMDIPKTWVTLVQTVGFPTVASLAVCWFANRAIEYERDRMTPALECSTKAMESNTQFTRDANETMKQVRDCLIRMEGTK